MIASHPFLDLFLREFYPQLDPPGYPRAGGFLRVFEHLTMLPKPVIVETGTARSESWTDGQSTILFDHFLELHGQGQLVSVDIDADACTAAQKRIRSVRTSVLCGDDIRVLRGLEKELAGRVDLLYLDSVDVDFGDPHPSALHHLQALTAAIRLLKRGGWIVVDDSQDATGRRGKGKYIYEFATACRLRQVLTGYQDGWQW
jgi:predicted O-methyltransferase YrrM